MFGRLKKFLRGNYAVPTDEAQQAAEQLYVELLALPEVKQDFTTPEGAILCLEDALRRRDLEAAVAAKDFRTEARLMLEKSGFKNCRNEETLAKMAETLELSFPSQKFAVFLMAVFRVRKCW